MELCDPETDQLGRKSEREKARDETGDRQGVRLRTASLVVFVLFLCPKSNVRTSHSLFEKTHDQILIYKDKCTQSMMVSYIDIPVSFFLSPSFSL